MTAREFVIRSAQLKGLSLIKPTRASPSILAVDFTKKDHRGIHPCVIDANTWAEAQKQITSYCQAR